MQEQTKYMKMLNVTLEKSWNTTVSSEQRVFDGIVTVPRCEPQELDYSTSGSFKRGSASEDNKWHYKFNFSNV